MIDLVFRNYTENRAYSADFFVKILEKSAKALKLDKKKIEVSISLVGRAKMRSLNKKYRQKDKPTDVLSFPLGEVVGTGYNEIAAGDIFICLPYIQKLIKSNKYSAQKYVSWTTVHGFLHLVGYDHPDDSVGTPTLRRRGEKMFALEKKILEK